MLGMFTCEIFATNDREVLKVVIMEEKGEHLWSVKV